VPVRQTWFDLLGPILLQIVIAHWRQAAPLLCVETATAPFAFCIASVRFAVALSIIGTIRRARYSANLRAAGEIGGLDGWLVLKGVHSLPALEPASVLVIVALS
jgi:hypothetical protein